MKQSGKEEKQESKGKENNCRYIKRKKKFP